MSSERPHGRSLELYFIDGRPDGMLTAEVFNWRGHVLMSPRSALTRALSRPEARQTGIYLLLGEAEGRALVYIGEGEEMRARIIAHAATKDWWNSMVLVTSAADTLNKAHVRYLEARLIERARAIGLTDLENGTAPPLPRLKEAEAANMEEFLDYLLMVLPALRVDIFLDRTRPGAASPAEDTPRFAMQVKKHGLEATAHLNNGEFVVLAGSLARAAWNGPPGGYAKLHAELCEAGVLAADGEARRFTQNYVFRSPSAAAAVVTGRSANGQLAWKHADTGLTYFDWEAQQLEQGTHP
ncbi:MAG: GIY-YIG nuclease family protein [Pseudomonadota bacterium]